MDVEVSSPPSPTGYLNPDDISDINAYADDHDNGYSTSDSTSYDSEEEEARLAQQDWENSVEQMRLLVQTILCPLVGRWAGRKFIFWGYDKFYKNGSGIVAWISSLWVK